MEYECFFGTLSFLREHVSAEDTIQIFQDLTLFQPTSFRSNLKNFKRLGKNNFWKQLQMNLEQDSSFSAYVKAFHQDPIRLDQVTMKYYPATDIIQISFMQNSTDEDFITEMEQRITAFAQTHSILSASFRSRGEYNWNDNPDLQLQRKNHTEIDVLKTVIIAQEEYADTSQFSGYTTGYDGVWFGCSCEMWFGKDYDPYIPLNVLASFQECESNQTYDNGTVHIRMFASFNDFDKLSSMERAFQFRKDTKCDEMYKYWKKKLSGQAMEEGQFTTEMENGTFPHGGVRLLKTYLDQNNQPIIKAKAVKVHLAELGTNGKTVFEEFADL